MLRRVRLWVVCGVVLAASFQASTAAAFGPGAYGLGFFNYGDLWNQGYRVPYYALFPPVYYSYPVARTYGYSPFAYPPGTITPDAPPVQAAVYLNPFVPQPAAGDQAEPTTDDKAAAAPRVYYNRFVKSAASAAPAQTASVR